MAKEYSCIKCNDLFNHSVVIDSNNITWCINCFMTTMVEVKLSESVKNYEMDRLKTILQRKYDQCMMAKNGNMKEGDWRKGFRECLEMVLREIGD